MVNLPTLRFPGSIAARTSRWKWSWTCRTANRAGAVLAGFLVSGVCGATTTAIEVSFELNLPAMTDLWSRDQGELQQITVERKVASSLRDRLEELFPYWKFDAATGVNSGAQAKREAKAPRITFCLHEEAINEALLTLEFEVEGWQPLVLEEVLWPPSKFPQAGLYGPLRAQKEIPGFFSKKLIEKRVNHDAIKDLLMKSVPLAEGGRWRTANPSALPQAIVLPLPYDRYEDLRESEFQLVCEKNRAVTRLIAVGTGESDSYPFSEGPKEALVGVITLSPSPAALKSNKPRYVYLNQYRPPSLLKLGRPAESDR